MKAMKPNSVAIFHSNDMMPLNGDAFYDFRQNSGLFGLCGLDQEETILVLYPDCVRGDFKEIVFTKKTNPYIAVWEGKTHDAISEIIEQVDSLNLTYQTTTNLNNFDNFSVNLSTSIPVKDWWTIRVNSTVFYNRFQTEFLNGSIDNKRWASYSYLSNNFTIKKGFTAELSAFYQSPMVYGIIRMDSQYAINAGLSKKVLDGKGNIKLSVDDIFNRLAFSGQIREGSINADVRNKWQSQRFKVAFSYRFGNDQVKGARHRKTATEEEKGRAKGGN